MLSEMVRQYRIERFNGLEFLVCEVYDRYFWNSSEYAAFEEWRKSLPDFAKANHADFVTELNEWCEQDHGEQDTFFGLVDPIPSLSPIPCMVLRGCIIDRRIRSLQVDFVQSQTNLYVIEEVKSFMHFTDSPHWRNTVAHQFERYGTLFTPQDDN